MVKPLIFKGDKKPKKRKRTADTEPSGDGQDVVPSKELRTNESSGQPEADEGDDSWVTAEAAGDIAGPVTFVLPTEPAGFLACDANGKVFVSPVENMVELDPGSAEPHDVRQVWVANRVAGTENISFKGHHGKYLSCDKFGILQAHREAISPEESFVCIPIADNRGTFAIQTQREKFLSVEDSSTKNGAQEVRGDAETICFSTTLRVRMQARFKPKLKKDKEQKALEKISRKQLEEMVGRRLEDDEVKTLKRARRDGNFHEVMLDVKVKGKHDKFA
ncbi:actin-crosslinking protein [Saccharata proteae CBS 121410]|uniref:Actin-crosslinking protein n=1 Tax=Saccharata proteae CBS 121410 TaxID=1314787 RepID=A0A9P4HXR2_9PEZI|nr:actin-crosslinking protein [Saccharata proteae CBS 121410]